MSRGSRQSDTQDEPLMIVALPRAVPIPLPFIAFGPTRLNLHTSRQFIVATTSDRRGGGDVHWRILQHVGHDEEADHAPADVHLIELGDTSIASRHCNVPERDVQVVLGCAEGTGDGEHGERVPSAILCTHPLRACRGRAALC